jgi:hypothetical protein
MFPIKRKLPPDFPDIDVENPCYHKISDKKSTRGALLKQLMTLRNAR